MSTNTVEIKVDLLLDKFDGLLNKFNTQIEGMGSKFNSASSSIDRSSHIIDNAVGFVAAGAFGKLTSVVGGFLSESFDVIQQNEQLRVRFDRLAGSTERAGELLKDITDFANKTKFEISGLSEAVAKIATYGVEISRAKDVTFALANVVSGTGGSMESFSRISLALGQTITRLNAGLKISQEELNQLREAGFPVNDLLSKLNINAGNLEKARISTIQFTDALIQLGNVDFAGAAIKDSESLGGKISTLKDTIMGLVTNPQLDGFGDKMSKYFFKPMIDGFQAAIDKGSTAVGIATYFLKLQDDTRRSDEKKAFDARLPNIEDVKAEIKTYEKFVSDYNSKQITYKDEKQGQKDLRDASDSLSILKQILAERQKVLSEAAATEKAVREKAIAEQKALKEKAEAEKVYSLSDAKSRLSEIEAAIDVATINRKTEQVKILSDQLGKIKEIIAAYEDLDKKEKLSKPGLSSSEYEMQSYSGGNIVYVPDSVSAAQKAAEDQIKWDELSTEQKIQNLEKYLKKEDLSVQQRDSAERLLTDEYIAQQQEKSIVSKTFWNTLIDIAHSATQNITNFLVQGFKVGFKNIENGFGKLMAQLSEMFFSIFIQKILTLGVDILLKSMGVPVTLNATGSRIPAGQPQLIMAGEGAQTEWVLPEESFIDAMKNDMIPRMMNFLPSFRNVPVRKGDGLTAESIAQALEKADIRSTITRRDGYNSKYETDRFISRRKDR